MGNTLPAIEGKLRNTPFYGPLFEAAFGSPDIDTPTASCGRSSNTYRR